jgi:hypothetical protein
MRILYNILLIILILFLLWILVQVGNIMSTMTILFIK